MGTGKSTVGPLLAQRLGREFIDLDAAIEAQVGLSVADIFARWGEAEFRRRERLAVRALAAEPPAVVGLGGGTVVDPANRACLKGAGTLVTLTATAETIWSRLAGDTGRPLLGPDRGSVAERMDRRAAAYADADVTVMTDSLTPQGVVEQVLERLAL